MSGNSTIFIALASYRDPLLRFTLESANANATDPNKITFGIVDQNDHSQREELKKLPFADRIRYCHLLPEETLGVSWARSLVYSLYNDEEYVLQVDSHTCFEPGWDESLINQLALLKSASAKPIVTTYPYDFQLEEGKGVYKTPSAKTVLVLRPHPEASIEPEDPVMRFQAKHLFTDEPVRGCHIAAGFFFCGGSFVEEIPYDPYLYFHGEEQSLALRAFTKGWDIYHPTHIPLYHKYKPAHTAHETHHWHGEAVVRRDFDPETLRTRARRRLGRLIRGELDAGAYGLGNVRSLEDFKRLSGIDYESGMIEDVYNGSLK